MADSQDNSPESASSGNPRVPGRFVLWTAIVLVPVLVAASWSSLPPLGRLPPAEHDGSVFARSAIPFRRDAIQGKPVGPPRIANVAVLDFDEDGRPDILACDARRGQVVVHLQVVPGRFRRGLIASDLPVPVHATPVDLDGDGDLDFVVACLGNAYPDDGRVGQVVWIENVGRYNGVSSNVDAPLIDPTAWKTHVLLSDVRRIADVQAGDLDGDGDIDLAVAEFGYARGRVCWLENQGDGRFVDHTLHDAAGTIHVPLSDYDGDGDLDIAAVVSQNDEELWLFDNDGRGSFTPRRIWTTANFDIGSAGLFAADLDSDGDTDLLLTVGDNLEYAYTYPQPYHGCLWFENAGDGTFQKHRLVNYGGCHAAAVADIDGDGDLDVALVSMFNDWYQPTTASVVWLENDGRQRFTPWQIDSTPTHLATVACGDFNGDGRADIVAGGWHVVSPFDRLGGITTWTSAATSAKTPVTRRTGPVGEGLP